MHSAFDGVHEFSVPAVVQQVQDAQWYVEPADAADLEPNVRTGGVMIRMRKPGDFKVFAVAGTEWGLVDLHVTAATPAQWARGEARYHDDATIDEMTLPADTGAATSELPNSRACENCHGASAPAFNLEHTPHQLGGYSDQELAMLFTTGDKPAGSLFRSTIPLSIFRVYHTWENASADEAQSLVVYLRSLQPKPQPETDFRRPQP